MVPFFLVTCTRRLTIILAPLTFLNRSLTSPATVLSLARPGSWMNAPPLVLGGMSPVVTYFSDSMIVCCSVSMAIVLDSARGAQKRSSRFRKKAGSNAPSCRCRWCRQ